MFALLEETNPIHFGKKGDLGSENAPPIHYPRTLRQDNVPQQPLTLLSLDCSNNTSIDL